MNSIVLSLVFLISTIGFSQSNFDIPEVKSSIPQSETLYELIDQYHALQQLHWNTKGPHFLSLHELTEEFYTELAVQIDKVAERKLALGYPADGNPKNVSEKSNLKSYNSEFSKDYKSVEIIVSRYLELSKRLADRIKFSSGKDLATQDVFIGLKYTIDHHLFLIRSFSY